jgi:N-acyl-D-aspartate/D-glutamate deacylase
MLPVMQPVSAADRAGKKRVYADPAFRRAFAAAASRWQDSVIASSPSDPSLEERRLADAAAERGVAPVDLMFDLALASDLEARFRIAVLNTDDAIVGELLAHPATLLGLSDAGAHASQLCDAGAPTTLLGKWARERRTLRLEEAVWRLTGQPAALLCLAGRGRLAAGCAADVVVFDPETVDCGPVRRVFDLPGGADRLVADAAGIDAVIVNGVVVREHGRDAVDPEGPLPGRVLRGRPQAARSAARSEARPSGGRIS